jgi:S-layer protein
VDNLSGGAGTDTLNFTAKGGAVNLGSLSSIEVINGQSLGALTLNASAVSDLTKLNVTKAAGAVALTASATADVSVAMTAAGAAVGVAGGKNVTVGLTDVAGAADVVSVGVGADADAAGDVSVTMTGKAYTTATANTTLSAVNVTGGKTITVTQKAAADISAATADTINTIITQGNVTIIGNADTSAVTLTQDAAVTAANAVFKTGGVTESASAKFSALTAGQTIIMGGLTFTAPSGMTAAEAAAAFANLVNNAAFAAPASVLGGDTQSAGAASKGTYTNVFSGWTSAAASGDTVVFTSTTANTNVADLANAGTGTVTITTTAGKAHDAGAADGKMGVVNGTIFITDSNATIKTITINGYTTGSTTTTSVLETLNLSNGAAGGTLTVADTAATLALNVEKLGTSTGDAVLTITAAPTTLNVNSIGANYVNLTAAATESLNVSGTGVFDADPTDLAALKTVTVTQTAGLKLNAGVANTVTSVNTTGTTGSTTVTIEGARATYAGGAGVDTVTLATDTALTKSIDLGAGDDVLSFGTLAVTGSTATLSGGEGTDTLAMTVAAADGLDGSKQTFYTNFERLALTNSYNTGATADDSAADTLTLNLDNLGFTSYVGTAGTGNGGDATQDILVLDKMVSNGTVVLTANGLVTVNVKDAATGTADVLNVVVENINGTGNITAGTLTAANVETVNIKVSDGDNTGPDSHSLTLTADKATSVVIANADAGDKTNFTLTMTGSTKVTSIDGSAMEGGLTVTSLNTTSATTIKGGSGNDVLTAATGTTADVLLGGSGNDVLVANAGLTTMTGGEGADVFRIDTASLNVNSYATITDFASGDLIQINGIASFASAKVSLGDTAVFQDYANAAINSLAANAAGWFQFGGNTYVVADMGADGTTFTNSQDFIVKLTGLVDLTNASFNNTYDTIAL